MPTYKQNREKIKKKLHEINTIHDREQAYEETINYILKVAMDAWEGAAKQYGEDGDDLQALIKRDIKALGLIPDQEAAADGQTSEQ